MASQLTDKIYRLEEIISATDNFSPENLITEGVLGKVYKGKPLRDGDSTEIAIRRFTCEYETGDELEKEISMLKRFNNKNIASVLGRCDENNEKIIIYKQVVNGTLDYHLSKKTLTWSQRLQICLGVARALNHIHYDFIHCDIYSSKIFLDKDWEPKIYGFELSTEYPTTWRDRLLVGKNMTPKHDVYCFGVLLFEVLYERKPMITKNVVHEEPDMINYPNSKKQIDPKALFKKLAYNCLNQQHVQRPTMDQIVKELDDMLEFQRTANLNAYSMAADEGTSSNSSKIDLLNITLSKIKEATQDFNEECCVGCGGFGEVYKAELDVLDIQILSSTKAKCEDEIPKIRKTVAIKRLFRRKDEQDKQGFLTEIKLLTSCNHQNVISLLGFSEEDDEMIIVYEYAEEGSLSGYLERSGKTVTWAQRIQICLDVACGINYLHTVMEEKPMIIHRDIKSDNILLDENLNAKIADFGLSKFHLMRQQSSAIHTLHIVGTDYYLDPEVLDKANYKRASDIYSFGVVLFEVLSGRMAYDLSYIRENKVGLAPIARRRFIEKTIKELLDPTMIEDDEHIFTFNKGPNRESFDKFSKIAYDCLAETQTKRPTMEVIINELQNALLLQGKTITVSRFRFSDIKLATKNFDETYVIGVYTNGTVYRAKIDHLVNNNNAKNNVEPSKKYITVAIKRFTGRSIKQVKQESFAELEMLTSFKHPKIVSLLGLCDEGDEMILIYQDHASNKRLDEYLKSADSLNHLTWTQRLHICLEIALGLEYFHTNMAKNSDIKSANIVLDKNCHAKIAYFGISKLHGPNPEVVMKVYEGPEYETIGKMEIKSDIYSFGVVLFEIFCGRLAYDPVYIEDGKGLAPIARRRFKDGTIERMIDSRLKEENDEDIFTSTRRPNKDSLDTFLRIAYQCLGVAYERPTMEIVIKELGRAINFQGKTIVLLRFQLSDIKSATKNFDETYCIGSYTNGTVYRAKVYHFGNSTGKNNPEASKKHITVSIKRFTSGNSRQVKQECIAEFKMLTSYKRPNIVSVLGYCDEGDEMILVYQDHASNKRLDKYLKSVDFNNLMWTRRLHMCLEIAHGLEYFHTNIASHSDIKSANIVLDKNCHVKIAYFGISKLHGTNEEVVMKVYQGPEYETTGKLEIKSDIYSFGVVLFEIFCGRLAYDPIYIEVNGKGLAPIARRRFEDGTIERMIDPKLKEETDEDIFTSTRGPNKESLNAFLRIAYQCLGVADERPTMEIVIKGLERAIDFQGKTIALSRFRLSDIKLATKNFEETYCIGLYTNGSVYKAEIYHSSNSIGKNNHEPSKKRITVAIKRFSGRISMQVKQECLAEFKMLGSYMHPKIVSVIGFCDEDDEMILVYEDHSLNKQLDECLGSVDYMNNLTWTHRLHICLDVAHGLEYFHTNIARYSNIKSANVVLDKNFHAKIAYFGISKLHGTNEEVVMKVYQGPEYETTGKLEIKSDIYSFGVVSFEIFCGRLAYDPVYIDVNGKGLAPIARRRFEDGTIERMIDPKLKEENDENIFTSRRGPNSDSLDAFLRIAYQCLGVADERPTMELVIKELERAIDFQTPEAVEKNTMLFGSS